ncbi:MAG: hypothetical protein AAGD11_08560 [Planctomycetota bacterium]
MNDYVSKWTLRFAGMLLCVIATTSLTGCGSETDATAIVQGTVTLDGELAKSGGIVFHSKGSDPTAYGTIGGDGSFAMRVGRGNADNIDRSKIYAGEYTATVTLSGPPVANEEYPGAPPTPGPQLSSSRYANKATSGLDYTIKAGMNVITIAVESPSEEELAAMVEAAAAEEVVAEVSEDEAEPEASPKPTSEAATQAVETTDENDGAVDEASDAVAETQEEPSS